MPQSTVGLKVCASIIWVHILDIHKGKKKEKKKASLAFRDFWGFNLNSKPKYLIFCAPSF